jgi:NADPH:quinone reductase-like Zn-dependent oxidoreductase
MIDVHSAILTVLEADAPLVALVNTRVFAGRDVPPPRTTPGGGACLTFKVRGGAGAYRGRDYEDALIVPSVQFKSYAASELAAYTVYRALVDALHNGHDGTVLHAEEAGVGQPLEEPDTEWRFVLSFFDVMVRSA